jgi:hypothetical protein
MGCSQSPITVENKEDNANNKQSEDIIHILYLKITKLIKDNPFYKTPIDSFNKLDFSNENFNNIDDILKEIITEFFENQETFVQILFKDIVKYSYIKFKDLIQDEIGNDLLKLIVTFLYIFLSEPQPGKKELFNENLKLLLNKINQDNNNKNNKNNENKFKTAVLFTLLINLIQMFSFTFASLFVFFIILDNFGNYKKENFEDIINAKTPIKEVESIINNNLREINKKISPNFLSSLVISEINNKIINLIDENKELITLEDYQIKIISDSVFDSIYINNYVDYLFFGENHDY